MVQRVCVVADCRSRHLAKGYCRKHYLRFYKTGDPLKAKRDRTPAERFWPHVDKRGPDDCWPWMRPSERYGAVHMGAKAGYSMGAHRLSYILHHGPIPDGMLVMHSCDNPSCVNPAHLSAGTPKDNMDDMHRKGRSKPGRVLGEAKPLSKLTDDAVRYIRTHSSEPTKQLAGRFGVCTRAIRDVIHGKYWTHVT